MRTFKLCIWHFSLFILGSVFSCHNNLLASGSPRTRDLTVFVKTVSGTKLAIAYEAPLKVKQMVYAANQIIGKPYKWGGGHRVLHDSGYDCSGAVSYVLSRTGIIPGSKHCREFLSFGQPGKGRWVTLYVSRTHIFMSLCGRTFDVFVNGRKTGPRWVPEGRSTKGFQARRIPGI